MLWLFSGVSFWCLSLGMDELDKLREEVASLRDEMAFFRGRVAAIEEKKEALAMVFRDTILELRDILKERDEDLSERVRMLVAMNDNHLKRMSHVLDEVEAMNKRLLNIERDPLDSR
jgi:hypothetical protein